MLFLNIYMNTYTDLKLFKIGQFILANFLLNFVTLSKANLTLQRKIMESNYQGLPREGASSYLQESIYDLHMRPKLMFIKSSFGSHITSCLSCGCLFLVPSATFRRLTDSGCTNIFPVLFLAIDVPVRQVLHKPTAPNA